jgi:hypothetical protein
MMRSVRGEWRHGCIFGRSVTTTPIEPTPPKGNYDATHIVTLQDEHDDVLVVKPQD